MEQLNKKRLGNPHPDALKKEVPLAGALVLLLYLHQTFAVLSWASGILTVLLLFLAMRHFLQIRKATFLFTVKPWLSWLGLLLTASVYLLGVAHIFSLPYMEISAAAFGIGLILLCLHLYLQHDNEHVGI